MVILFNIMMYRTSLSSDMRDSSQNDSARSLIILISQVGQVYCRACSTLLCLNPCLPSISIIKTSPKIFPHRPPSSPCNAITQGHRMGGVGWCICWQQKSDVINNNKALDQHPLFGGYMDHHCNFTNKYESATPECPSTDSPHFQPPESLVKKQEGSSERRGAYWNDLQYKWFLRFWMEKLIQMPLNSYSFDAPLKRSHHFQQLSQFLSVRLGPQLGKGSQQCKSKFATIRRKIQREKIRGKRVEKYGFIDYIIEEGIKTAEADQDTLLLLQRLQDMHGTDSEFMSVTLKIYEMERRDNTVELKNNNIYAYLMELDRLPAAVL